MTDKRFHTATSIIIVTVIVGLIAWDITTISIAGVDTTISRISLRFLTLHPVIALAAGALVGHLTWGTEAPTNRPKEVVLLIASLVLMVGVDLYHAVEPMTPLWPFLLGIPIGHAMWGQNTAPAVRVARAIRRA